MSTMFLRATALAALVVMSGCTRGLPGSIDQTASNALPNPPVRAVCVPDAAKRTEAEIAAMPAGAIGQFVVSFTGTHAPDNKQLDLLRSLGIQNGLTLRYLPIAGVLATREQALRLMQAPGVRSVRVNHRLTLDDDVANNLTSVDHSQQQPELVNAAGQPITGAGVTVLVNDSGIDATHLDLLYTRKVLQNALGHLNALGDTVGFNPHLPIENIPNTDELGSHGSHVAGIVAGDGTLSSGKYTGSAKGASLVGYGSGAALFVLDTLGGFDYALQILDKHPEFNLRIVTNSFGETADVGTCFDPENPTNIATKALADKGLIVVFSAGNSGSGPDTITGNFKKAPWVLTAANATKAGQLAPSSSRGSLAHGSYETVMDGETYIVEDRPTVATPGTNIISARATAADPFAPLDIEADATRGDIAPAMLPFYTQKSGTSMAAPHLAGLTALLLEANPRLTWRELRQIFKQTATNMVGTEPWESGAGLANAEAALAMALNLRKDYGSTNNALRVFNSVIELGLAAQEMVTLAFNPVTTAEEHTFEVGKNISLVTAQWTQPLGNACTCALVLIDPAGNQFGSSIALPELGATVAALGPGMEGTWTLTVRGIGSVSGVSVDPLHLTNGVAGPASLDILLTQYPAGERRGLDDIGSHPAKDFIEFAVGERLVDGLPGGFKPAELLTRAQMGEYLMSWGVRQTRAHSKTLKFTDTEDALAAIADAVTAPGHLIMDLSLDAAPMMSAINGKFEPLGTVSRQEMAFALIQGMGREALTAQYEGGTLFVNDANQNVVNVADADEVAPALRNHVQDALALGILTAEFVTVDGATKAYIHARREVTRAEYASTASRAYSALPLPSDL